MKTTLRCTRFFPKGLPLKSRSMQKRSFSERNIPDTFHLFASKIIIHPLRHHLSSANVAANTNVRRWSAFNIRFSRPPIIVHRTMAYRCERKRSYPRPSPLSNPFSSLCTLSAWYRRGVAKSRAHAYTLASTWERLHVTHPGRSDVASRLAQLLIKPDAWPRLTGRLRSRASLSSLPVPRSRERRGRMLAGPRQHLHTRCPRACTSSRLSRGCIALRPRERAASSSATTAGRAARRERASERRFLCRGLFRTARRVYRHGARLPRVI